MAIPVRPTPGSPVASAWGNAVQDQLGLRWRFVNTPHTIILNAVAQGGAVGAVEATNVPANTPGLVAIEVYGRVLDPTTTANYLCNLYDFDGTARALAYASGVANRGGSFGPFRLVPGGTNGRQVKYSASSGAQLSLYSSGYWVTTDA